MHPTSSPRQQILPRLAGRVPATIAAVLLATFLVLLPGSAGALSFSSGATYPIASYPYCLVAADLNSDGIVDLVTCNSILTRNVSVLIGTGNGSFAPAVHYPVVDQPGSLSTVDLDRDGDLDMVVVNSGAGSVSILLNDGTGVFAAAAGSPVAVGNSPIGSAAADFNGDGNPDVAVANTVDDTVTILFGNGSGGFGATATVPARAGSAPFAIAAGDLNGDGRPDLVVSHASGTEQASVLLNNGSGGFLPAVPYAGGSNSLAVALGDLDGDGRLDMVVASRWNDNIGIRLGNGTGSFGALATYPAVDPGSVVIGDVDRDGRNDVVIGIDQPTAVVIRLGNGDGTLQAPWTIPLADEPRGVVIRDFDGDGAPDLAIAESFGAKVRVMLADKSAPGAPTIGTASAGNAQISVAFAAPAFNGGSPILDYVATCGTRSATGASSPLVVTGLTNGTAYTCTVVARSAAGTSAPSAASNSATPATIPGAPTIGTAIAGNSQISVAFTAPASNGGAAILDYTAACGSQSATGLASPITVSGLVNGTAYTCTVVARNTVGTGPASTASNSATPTTNTYSGPSATGSGTITATFSGGGPTCTYTVSRFIPLTGDPASPPAGTAPIGTTFPHGLFDFTTSGCTPASTITMTITYPTALLSGTQYWKYGPTPGNTTPHWYVLPATITSNTVTFTITDGALGDDDLTANGTIVDQGGPGVPGSAIGVPTLSEWAMLLLASLVMLAGMGAMRRR